MASYPKKTPPTLAEQYQRISLWHLLNIPNALTLARLCSIPVFLALLSKHEFTAALYVFGFAALTDALDGTVARWFDSRTEIGAILDMSPRTVEKHFEHVFEKLGVETRMAAVMRLLAGSPQR